MFRKSHTLSKLTVFVSAACLSVLACAGKHHDDDKNHHRPDHSYKHQQPVEVGPRPFYLVEDMDASPLKRKLQSCAKGPFRKTDFSIGHRGAQINQTAKYSGFQLTPLSINTQGRDANPVAIRLASVQINPSFLPPLSLFTKFHFLQKNWLGAVTF